MNTSNDITTENTKERTELFLENNKIYLEKRKRGRKSRFVFIFNRRLKKMYDTFLTTDSVEKKLAACTAALDEFDRSLPRRLIIKLSNLKEDSRLRKVSKKTGNGRRVIDNSDQSRYDYYSVVVIVKNEARYMQEFILFYQATGADRIYIYDNGSTDNLLEVLEAFIKSGFVVYKRWPGTIAQTAAYRDAIRRTKKRTKWLAIVDADEYLFSPKGSMPNQLKEYEDYPGIGVNWVIFGPNGHEHRPDGLIMDNYITALSDHNHALNCHIKSIVQPDQVFSINHTHYPIYKNGRYAVDEEKNQIDNRNAFNVGNGMAFTANNHREVFRINHYKTKSLEDLKEKCSKGYADGAPNALKEDQLIPFREPLEEDHTIRRYADIVRDRISRLEIYSMK